MTVTALALGCLLGATAVDASAATVSIRYVRTGPMPDAHPDPRDPNPVIPIVPIYRLELIARPGETNDVRVVADYRAYPQVRVTDAGAPLEAGPGCSVREDASVACQAHSIGIDPAFVDLGDGDDRATFDTVHRGLIRAGAGDDAVRVDSGAWMIDGGPGADSMVGAGSDAGVTYASRTAPVTVTTAGGDDDGEAGEHDDVRDVRVVEGGAAGDRLEAGLETASLRGLDGNDTLIASDRRESALDGGAGDDRVQGGTGFDAIQGSLGTDTISGGAGFDLVEYAERTTPLTVTLDGVANDGAEGENDNVADDVEGVRGGQSDDLIVGSDGPNHLSGGHGSDVIDGRGGDDELFGESDRNTGADELIGGPGRDRFAPGGIAGVSARDGEPDRLECTASVPLLVTADPGEFGGCNLFSPLRGKRRLRVSRGGRVAARVRCPRGPSCLGTIEIADARGRIGFAEFGLGQAESHAIRVRLSARARRALRRRALRATETVTLRRLPPPAPTHAASRTVTLLPAARRR